MHVPSLFLLTLEAGTPWWNYPGLELWKFFNLFILILAALYLHRRFGRPLTEALRVRGERIKRELHKAREEKERAEAKLAEVEMRAQRLDDEIALIREQAKKESEAERERIKLATDVEVRKLRQQAQREIERASKAAILELRRFAAEQSVTLAEEALRREMQNEDDDRLIGASLQQLGRGGN
jgi:F-type H+-transporting ATPase subunit b